MPCQRRQFAAVSGFIQVKRIRVNEEQFPNRSSGGCKLNVIGRPGISAPTWRPNFSIFSRLSLRGCRVELHRETIFEARACHFCQHLGAKGPARGVGNPSMTRWSGAAAASEEGRRGAASVTMVSGMQPLRSVAAEREQVAFPGAHPRRAFLPAGCPRISRNRRSGRTDGSPKVSGSGLPFPIRGSPGRKLAVQRSSSSTSTSMLMLVELRIVESQGFAVFTDGA